MSRLRMVVHCECIGVKLTGLKARGTMFQCLDDATKVSQPAEAQKQPEEPSGEGKKRSKDLLRKSSFHVLEFKDSVGNWPSSGKESATGSHCSDTERKGRSCSEQRKRKSVRQIDDQVCCQTCAVHITCCA